MKELNLDFATVDDCTFHLDMPGVFNKFYTDPNLQKHGILEQTGEKLSTFITNFGQISKLEIYYGKDKDSHAVEVGNVVKDRINRILSLPNSSLLDKNAPGVKLLVLDRTYD